MPSNLLREVLGYWCCEVLLASLWAYSHCEPPSELRQLMIFLPQTDTLITLTSRNHGSLGVFPKFSYSVKIPRNTLESTNWKYWEIIDDILLLAIIWTIKCQCKATSLWNEKWCQKCNMRWKANLSVNSNRRLRKFPLPCETSKKSLQNQNQNEKHPKQQKEIVKCFPAIKGTAIKVKFT